MSCSNVQIVTAANVPFCKKGRVRNALLHHTAIQTRRADYGLV